MALFLLQKNATSITHWLHGQPNYSGLALEVTWKPSDHTRVALAPTEMSLNMHNSETLSNENDPCRSAVRSMMRGDSSLYALNPLACHNDDTFMHDRSRVRAQSCQESTPSITLFTTDYGHTWPYLVYPQTPCPRSPLSWYCISLWKPLGYL